MTVAIPEVSTAATRSRATAARKPASSAPSSSSSSGTGGRRVINAQVVNTGSRGRTGPTGGQGQQGPQGKPGKPAKQQRSQTQAKSRSSSSGKSKSKGQQRRREAARRITGANTRPGSTLHNYQAIVAVEFVGAVLLAALAPIATRAPTPTQGGPQLQASTSGATSAASPMSPYDVGDLVKIFAIGITYTILEFLAAGPRGLARFSAWFGFLIFVTVGLSELAHLADIFKMISGALVDPVKLTGTQAPASPGGKFQQPNLGQAGPGPGVKPPTPST